jgi:4-hydroxythreonine-4-phosphate dehydrogenase
MPLRIGITLGDPAGIGPEIVERALASEQFADAAEFKVIGDRTAAKPGKPTRRSAEAALAAMEEAAHLANEKAIDAIVTGPIHKARMIDIGFGFPGQTEFFAARSATTNHAMLLTSGVITVALVTTHIALRQVPDALTTPEIARVGQLLAQFLHRRGLFSPRIAVAGLNPHAGESGNIGCEEIEIVAPAVAQLNSFAHSGLFSGPLPPDTVFHRAANGEFDAVLCMYHDQGLIPLKLHGFDQGVNVTLGLPYPRTSPDHGTAFEIAGKSLARPDSMMAAIKLAIELGRSR